ncbi:MAG TPA: RNA 2',3'-cyclic phosphodiesterase [Dehalococcoidia bacterium]
MASEAAPETCRLFVALELPEAWRRALARLQGDLRARGLAGLRWVRPEGIHLTLKFLGGVPAPRVPEIDAALRAVLAEEPGFALRLGAPGTFGGPRPRVVWVGVEGAVPALASLQRRVEAALVPLGFPPEARPFAPHLTLARVPEGTAPGLRRTLAAALAQVGPPPAPEFRVRSVSLMESFLRPDGAVYVRRAAYPPGGDGG